MKQELFETIPQIENEYLLLKQLTDNDADALTDLIHNDTVYRYLPNYLFEKQFTDPHEAIRQLYGDLLRTKSRLYFVFFSKGVTSSVVLVSSMDTEQS
ncbi:MAG: hypothetical protein IJ125_09130 [Atopobiaceae bacterium]|nr:hypothetical protein [Atopobiaceae bacterium]